MLRRLLLFSPLLLAAVSAHAQSAPAPPQPEPAIRRWLDVQTFTIYTRYRFIETNRDVVTSNDQQYKESIRFRLNADAKKRYGVTFGFASGSNFVGSWNNTGIGIGARDGKDNKFKQLYASASPITGFEFQIGGLYIVRGESTEISSYDDDGYLMGERVSIRRPKQLFFDEISVTQAALTSLRTPNVFRRFDDFNDQRYSHVLVAKRLSPVVATSGDYTRLDGANTIRGAVSLRFKPTAPLALVRLEGYYRTNASEAGGFVATAERPVTKWARLQAGYASIDENYGDLNGDRYLRGRRFFAIGTIPIRGPLSGSLFYTHALPEDYTLSIHRRFDAVLQYDVMAALRRAGKI